MPEAIRQLFGSVVRVNRSGFDGLAALRCTIGVAVSLVFGVASASSTAAVFRTLGAFGVGFGSFQGAYRSRAVPMLLATLGMAISAFIGSLAGHSIAPALALAGLWGFCGGLLVALGQAASFVGLQSIIAAVIASGFPSDLGTAFGRAALVLGGGLVQTLLVVMIWPLRRFSAERRSLSGVYQTLATYASSLL